VGEEEDEEEEEASGCEGAAGAFDVPAAAGAWRCFAASAADHHDRSSRSTVPKSTVRRTGASPAPVGRVVQ